MVADDVHNMFDKAKEGIGSVIHATKLPHFHKETHGRRDDIDENTPLDDVKAPNVFERAKEEIEALVEAIHQKKESHDDKRNHSTKEESNHEKRENGVKSPNLIESAKEDIEALVHKGKEYFHKESHGKDSDSDEDDVKVSKVFEQAKEEIESLVETIHQKIESHTDKRDGSTKAGSKHEKPGIAIKASNLIEKAKDKIDTILNNDKSPNHHYKETHGRNDDIDENTPIDEVKAPNLFERAKEEIDAIVGTMQPKIESNDSVLSAKEEGGFRHCLGVGLEKVCHPWGSKRD
ncbi:hypothetical protein COLO4_18181 [Corchorus olitorius]|uniref:Uncharacterized protein n=1 Tax=Corchorus olitorius TaxID=93759 RepID=A0A1R3JA26_9ROSI|nr:hypothetical protein COLO4_18181 [Corchorus olitorius]